jgi:hypothetical protein
LRLATGWRGRDGARALAAPVVAAAALLWVALANGYPLVFSDTGGYLRIGTELYFPLDRPASYGLLIAPLHWIGGPWAVAIAQALFAAGLIGRALSVALGEDPSRRRPIGVALLLTLTSLPWFAGQVMPDLFTGLLPLALFVLVWGAAAMRPAERLGWTAVVAGVIALHLTHLPIAAAIWCALLLCSLATGTLRRNRTGATLAAAALVLAVLGMSTLNLIGAGRFRPSLMSGTFLFARLLDGRVAQPVLADSCRRERLELCALLPAAARPDADLPGQAYLWGPAAFRPRDPERVAEEERLIVGRTLAAQPDAVARMALHGWAGLLVTADIGDGLGRYGEERAVTQQIRAHFPASAPRWAASLQQRDALTRLARPSAVALSVLAAAVLLTLLALRRVRGAALALVAALVVTVMVNAAVCGMLSGVFARYQSRVIWLMPFAAIVAALAAAGARRRPDGPPQARSRSNPS